MPPTDRGGGIIRVAHNKDNPYTLINRTFTDDPALSWEARGLLAYLLCKPDNWKVYFADLLRRGKNTKRDRLQRILKELEAAGYLVRERTHDPATGHWSWESTVYETPLQDLPVMAPPVTAGRLTEKAVAYIVPTAESSNDNEYGANAPPPRVNGRNPSAAEVQAGTAPSRPTPPGERR